MQIRELAIDQFGVWKNVSFPCNERGVTIFYGPNEAGKSTLMHFIRGVLYGFPLKEDSTGGPGGPHFHHENGAGGLRVSHQGHEYLLKRMSQAGTRGRLEINGRPADHRDPLLGRLIGQIPEPVFENIFAVGLHELQQLATLEGEEVAQHIYGLSLGPEGEQILHAHQTFMREESRLAGSDGEVASLLRDLKNVDRELARRGEGSEKYSRLQADLEMLEEEAETTRQRQANLQLTLRGHQLMNRISEPWTKQHRLQRQLDSLPADDVDREILNQYDELELELSQVDDRRQQLIAEARQLQKEAELIKTRPELEEQTCQIQRLFESSRHMQAVERERSAQCLPGQRNHEIDQLLRQFRGSHDLQRLEHLDATPSAIHHFLRKAEDFRRMARGRQKQIRRYKAATQKLRHLEQQFKVVSKDLGEGSLSEGIKNLQRRIRELQELDGLRLRRSHLKNTLDLVRGQSGGMTVSRSLPPFFWMTLWFFVVGGIVLAAAGGYAWFHGYEGIVAGRATAWIVGACMMLAGIASITSFGALKRHFEKVELDAGELSSRRESLEHELQRTEQAINRLTQQTSVTLTRVQPPPHVRLPLPASDDEQIKVLRERLRELESHSHLELQHQRLRRRLSRMRKAIQDQQRSLGKVKREWCLALRDAGLPEDLNVSVGLEQWEVLLRIKSILEQQRSSDALQERKREELSQFLNSVRELSLKIEGRDLAGQDPYQLVSNWERELHLLGERRRERTRLRQSAREKRREAAKLLERIEQMRQKRMSLLKRLGVADRGEIAAKLAAIDERKTLEHQISEIRKELQQIMEAESDLAIVEDELLHFDRARNQQAMERLKTEIAELEEELQEIYESLGQCKQELREIESDRSMTSLRFERQQITHALRNAVEGWYAVRLADRTLEQLRGKIEKERQPQVLSAASKTLSRLTCGKYSHVWTPLREQTLMIDDDQGHSLRVEQLSSGTREQVFLAVRIAMIRDFAQQGTELPMILDDVTVNFDQTRTEAAVDTLIDLAEQGQQVLLFTCHLHLAHLFQNRGLEPIWLPMHRAERHLQL